MHLRFALAAATCIASSACGPTDDHGVLGTVDLGDNFVAPSLQLDEAFFFCRIQPEVLTRYSCAAGEDGEAGSCHNARSALRLVDTDDPPPCDGDGNLVGNVPDAYRDNLDAVRFSVQSDPLTSPLYLRPVSRASHPRAVYDEGDDAAELVYEWIAAGAR